MNAVVPTEAPRLPTLQSGGAVRAIVPQDFEGAWRIANAVVVAGMAPSGLETPEKAMVAIMHGLEVGLTPMAALQSIAVVNGRPTIWGDGAIGLVRGSGKCEYIREELKGDGEMMVAVCEVKRKGEERPIIARFSVADAKLANLWGKKGPWQQYPKRMMAMRARAFALRDGFADVLRGLGIAEEVQDFVPLANGSGPPVPPKPPVPPSEGQTIEHEPTIPDTGGGQGAEVVDMDTCEITSDSVADSIDADQPDEVDDKTYFENLDEALAVAPDEASIEEAWNEADPEARFEGNEPMQSLATMMKNRALKRVAGKKS